MGFFLYLCRLNCDQTLRAMRTHLYTYTKYQTNIDIL